MNTSSSLVPLLSPPSPSPSTLTPSHPPPHQQGDIIQDEYKLISCTTTITSFTTTTPLTTSTLPPGRYSTSSSLVPLVSLPSPSPLPHPPHHQGDIVQDEYKFISCTNTITTFTLPFHIHLTTRGI